MTETIELYEFSGKFFTRKQFKKQAKTMLKPFMLALSKDDLNNLIAEFLKNEATIWIAKKEGVKNE